MRSERGGLSSTIHSASEMSQNIYTAAQLALKSRSCAGTRQTAPGHWEKSRTSSEGWLGPLEEQQEQLLAAEEPRAVPAAAAPTLAQPGLQSKALLPEGLLPKYRIHSRQS